ncbi:MAG: 4-(cytidine 5'-diphospho)-2-C-methyl-D-erythritol kinase [Gemmatimonadaceae bacterium]
MSLAATVRAQAKLNLWLRVLAREESGYHSIETLFHRIDLADDVTVTLAPRGERSVSCSVDVGPPEQNLAHRAAEQYCAATGWETGFHIDIVKRIPAGGGLGGGSADAAATLRALNALSDRPAPDGLLLAIASGLGADVPFLASHATMALGWGRGDRLLELLPREARDVALLLPMFRVATADAYRWVDERGIVKSDAVCIRSPSEFSAWPSIPSVADNAFTLPVDAEVGGGIIGSATTRLLNAGAAVAGMTGSGSTIFGIFDETPDADALARDTGCTVIVTRTATAVEAVRCSD